MDAKSLASRAQTIAKPRVEPEPQAQLEYTLTVTIIIQTATLTDYLNVLSIFSMSYLFSTKIRISKTLSITKGELPYIFSRNGELGDRKRDGSLCSPTKLQTLTILLKIFSLITYYIHMNTY